MKEERKYTEVPNNYSANVINALDEVRALLRKARKNMSEDEWADVEYELEGIANFGPDWVKPLRRVYVKTAEDLRTEARQAEQKAKKQAVAAELEIIDKLIDAEKIGSRTSRKRFVAALKPTNLPEHRYNAAWQAYDDYISHDDDQDNSYVHDDKTDKWVRMS